MKNSVVFYDGACGLCSRSVLFLLQNEKDNSLRFCALQSETAREFFLENNLTMQSFDTIVFWDGTRFFFKSNAVLRLFPFLKTRFVWLKIAWVFPRFIRDFVYDRIAQNRKRFFKNTCALPTEVQKNRFIC
jgi:predicted DCC family thiol-disulfide oxidoreductase YuxK